MKTMFAVAELTLRRLREGTFYILLLISVIVSILADNADPLTGQVAKESLFGYALSGESVNVPPVTAGSGIAVLICVLLGVFFGSSEIPGDINSGLVMVMLSKPVNRLRYMLGKYLAIVGMAVGIFIVIEIALIASHFIFGTGAVPYSGKMILRQFIPMLTLFPMVAITLACSTVAGAMGAMVFTTVYIIFSLVLSFMPLTLALFPPDMFPGLGLFMTFVHYLFPNLLYYFQDSVNGTFLVSTLVAYTIGISGIFLIVGYLRFRSVDLSPLG